ncbi:acyl-CoA dehydrogenase/oxidase [Gymnopilus junonius]|uniref:Acyl-CoA dehydrogenase/oxidase n=1 Tax=Gymnopilus junonius TaxID=109634 RepID=A0A9P5NQM0_GYMJU|nr:acyl-CoA dehydrogenase/oxidase [Gymnopilus junonius]
MRVEEGFQPIPFSEENAYTEDPVLPSLLRRILPKGTFQEIEPDLERIGSEVVTSIRTLSDSAKCYPPKLLQYNQWGRRIDELQTSEGWRELKEIAQREGLPGIFYERKHQGHSRTYGFAKILLMVGDTNEIFCPMSMTDGTARVIELLGSEEMKKDILPRLVSRDPKFAFTSGQWMTERPGGSDVSLTETTATSTGKSNKYGPQYTLNGFKWFSSATDSDVSVALARTGSQKEGSRGLSLFFVPLRLPLLRNPIDPVPSSTSNSILVHRLKNKIGTQVLPTAELSLEGTEAYLIGSLGKGVKSITPVLNITRVWSAITSVGNLRKCLAIATSYAKVRTIQSGTLLLKDAPVHVERLASINLLYRALTHLTLGVAGLLGKVECGQATEDDGRRLRMLTPVAKAYAADKACAGMEEAMAAMGGAGYMEENGFGRMIRDSLVEKIWEGTIVVLALDLAKVAQDPAAIKSFLSVLDRIITNTCPSTLQSQLSSSLSVLKVAIQEFATSYERPLPPLIPRPALMLAGAIASGVYLLEHAIWSHKNSEPTRDLDVEVFRRWVAESDLEAAIQSVEKAKSDSQERIRVNSALVFGLDAVKAKL